MIYYILILCFPFFAYAKELPSGITYQVEKEGLGTHLLNYMRAKWLSHLYEIPVRVKPFPHFNQLVLGNKELKLNIAHHNPRIMLEREEQIAYMDPTRALYTLPNFPEVDLAIVDLPEPPYIAADWKDLEFLKVLRKFVAPEKDIDEISLPKNRVSVALHVRRGLPTESRDLKSQNPLKFPPNSYYVAQLQRLNTLFQGRPLYVFIFTEDKNPGDIAQALEKELHLPHVKFDWHKGTYNHRAHVIDDLFNMMRFTCLVRPLSNYSLVAEILGNHRILIKPVSAQKGTIDQVYLDVKEE